MQSHSPTFVLGVGAQKAGTTWLFEYMNHFHSADFGDLKEYHIWDAISLKTLNDFDMRSTPISFRMRMRILKRGLLKRTQDASIIRRRLQSRPSHYFDYFEALLANEHITLTGDITPSYSGLSTQTLTTIKDGFERRGITVKVVFFMRDPVERSLSAIRMYRSMKRTREQGVNVGLNDSDAVLHYLDTAQFRVRGHYHETLKRLSNVFEADNVYVGLYENMFTIAEVERLSRFFNVQANPEFIEKRFNTSVHDSKLPQGVRAEAKEKLSDVYEYCFEHFPETKTLWAKDF